MEVTFSPFTPAADQWIGDVQHDGTYFWGIPQPGWTYPALNKRLVRSSNGIDWEISSDLSLAASYSVENIGISTGNGAVVVHARFMNPFSSASICILTSTDHGSSFNETFSQPLMSPMMTFNRSRAKFVFYTRPRDIFSPQNLTFYESDDGVTWTQRGAAPPNYPGPTLPNIYCRTSDGRMYVQGCGISDDGGLTWQHTERYYIGDHTHDFLYLFENDPESPYPYSGYWDWDYVAGDDGMYMFFEMWTAQGGSETWMLFSEDGNGWQETKCDALVQGLWSMYIKWIPESSIMVNILEYGSGDKHKQLAFSRNGIDWEILYDTQNMERIYSFALRSTAIS